MMQGQDLPSLPTAPEITTGTLPDGIGFYLVENKDRTGFADFALVQRSFGDETTTYRFRDVAMHLESAADSTLFTLFDIASVCREPQAVIVCGDIDRTRIRERMELLSMMVPTLESTLREPDYQWNPADTVTVSVSSATTASAAAIQAVYKAHRLPREVMNTPQALIARAYAEQLGLIVRQRVERSFHNAGIPLAGCRYDYFDSACGPGDERHSITVYTSFSELDAATHLLASELASLDKEGARSEEFIDARNRFLAQAARDASGRNYSNAEYVDKCVSAWLYGASLASEESRSRFLLERRLDDERELALFNGFAGALLDSAANLTLHFDVADGEADPDRLLRSFNQGWQETKTEAPPAVSPVFTRPGRKVRLRGDAPEPVSGGRLWTFSNGTKVIYKEIPGLGEFHYALLLRGGVAEVPGLLAGESAFVGDMLALSRTAGMNGADFREMLSSNGITMETNATLSDLRITGRAPRKALPLLLSALLSLSDSRKTDPDAFTYYRRSEALRQDLEAGSLKDINSLMDSVIHPVFFYTERRRAERLGDDLPQRAEQYFSSLFDKTGDGVFVFLGDLPEDVLKQELSRTLGGFRTGSGRSLRPRVEMRSATGSATFTAKAPIGAGTGVNVALSAAVPFNLPDYMSFRIACELIRERLATALAGQGDAEISHRLELFPEERLTLYINCQSADPQSTLDAVRSVTHTLSDMMLAEADIKAYKNLLLGQLENETKDPEALLGAVLTRFSEGKDLVSGWKAAIQGVSAESVAHILTLLGHGAEVEYLII
jgi:hypothetical protein